jgi:hypothetical protein
MLCGKCLSNEDEFSVFWANKLTIFFNISNQELFINSSNKSKKRELKTNKMKPTEQ